MIEDTLSKYLDMPEMRKALLAKFQVTHEENWQKQGTPEVVVTGMVDLVKDTPELLYVVLFNHEFLEELVFVRKVPKERVMFMADCKSEADLTRGVWGVKTFELPQTCRDPKQAIELLVSKIEKAFYNGEAMPKTNNLVVFGNPPYNSGSNGKDSKPIYNLFVEAIIDHINPRYFSFIMPSKWMVGGKIPESYRKRMMADRRHRSIKHFANERAVFDKDISVKGGVNYFLWDREYNGKCDFNGVLRYLDEYDIVVQDNDALPIVDRVHSKQPRKPGAYLDDAVLPRKPFGLPSNYNGFVVAGTPCHCQGNVVKMVDPTSFTDKGNVLGLWKVCTSKATSEGNVNPNRDGKYQVISNVFLIPPGEICTETYLVVKAFSSEDEAKNFMAYMSTKFFRFLLGENMAGNQNISKDNFAWVPELGSYGAPPTDEKLFKQFGLSEGEIEYINRRVK